jgi:hypothetical protein
MPKTRRQKRSPRNLLQGLFSVQQIGKWRLAECYVGCGVDGWVSGEIGEGEELRNRPIYRLGKGRSAQTATQKREIPLSLFVNIA